MARSEYFKSMFNSKYRFAETIQQLVEGRQVMGIIKVNGIPKEFFNCIIQFIYSDHFYIKDSDMTFFVKLLIYADYFMLHRLVEICSNYLEKFMRCKNVLPLLLVAHAHNAK